MSVVAATVDAHLDLLGRGVIVGLDDPVPGPWSERDDLPVVTVTHETISDRDALVDAVDRLHRAWVARVPAVIRLGVEPSTLKIAETFTGPLWEAGPFFDFPLERLRFLVRSNNYDARDGTPIWWAARTAITRGAGEHDGPVGDVTLPDGTVAWVDGGPRGLHEVAGVAVVHRESLDEGAFTLDREPAGPTGLADDQMAAVTHATGPARIVAPAGSGKTRVLTQRILHLLDRGWQPQRILAVAYNTRAADEMRSRLPDVNVEIRTVHSLALEILRWHADGTNRPRPRVLNEREVRAALARFVDTPKIPNTDPLGPWLDALGATRLALLDPAFIEDEFEEDLPNFQAVFAAWQDWLADNGAVDFDEMIYRACRLLVTDATMRSRVQARWRHVLWDEVQDATAAHLLLVRLVSAPELDVFAVGDPQQTIYSHNGADTAYLADMDSWCPGAVDHPLFVNYRCPVETVTATNQLLAPTKEGLPGPIRPAPDRREAPGSVTVELVARDDITATAVATLTRWLTDGTRPVDIAVLCRVNAGLLPVQVLVADDDLPFAPALTETILGRTGLRATLAYLALADDAPGAPMNSGRLAEVANRPSRRMTRKGQDLLRSEPTWTRSHLIAAMSAGSHGGDVAAAISLTKAVDELRKARHQPNATTRHLIDHIANRVGLAEAIRSLDATKNQADRSSHADDLDALRAVAAAHPDPSGFETWLRAHLNTPGTPDGIVLSTIHRTKGLEWDRVLVLDVSDGKLPHAASPFPDEERRIFHVAFTRARQQVCVIADKAAPSPFLTEAGLLPA